jgi:hypothetical protein
MERDRELMDRQKRLDESTRRFRAQFREQFPEFGLAWDEDL